jgi:hypothetical protein
MLCKRGSISDKVELDRTSSQLAANGLEPGDRVAS